MIKEQGWRRWVVRVKEDERWARDLEAVKEVKRKLAYEGGYRERVKQVLRMRMEREKL